MFTGIVQEIGSINSFERSENIYNIEVCSKKVFTESFIGDSVSVNGVCLTVTAKKKDAMLFDAMAETMRKTSLGRLKPKDAVNLECALKADGRLGGHFVLGHVDCVGIVKEMKESGQDRIMTISFSEEFTGLVVEKGSIAVDGVSLTVTDIEKGLFSVYLIPHTLRATTLGLRKRGDEVNLEFDIIGKYIMKFGMPKSGTRISEQFLREHGF
ncbi:MAG: riboflavin synthase [Candidatus Omnitrophica bacterium]|nr:riboflavin synthase [Candidatus Omnitrophota bacterium]